MLVKGTIQYNWVGFFVVGFIPSCVVCVRCLLFTGIFGCVPFVCACTSFATTSGIHAERWSGCAWCAMLTLFRNLRLCTFCMCLYLFRDYDRDPRGKVVRLCIVCVRCPLFIGIFGCVPFLRTCTSFATSSGNQVETSSGCAWCATPTLYRGLRLCTFHVCLYLFRDHERDHNGKVDRLCMVCVPRPLFRGIFGCVPSVCAGISFATTSGIQVERSIGCAWCACDAHYFLGSWAVYLLCLLAPLSRSRAGSKWKGRSAAHGASIFFKLKVTC